MNEPSSRDGPRRLALRVDAVDVLPTDLDSLLVRVAGSWEPGADRPGARPELVMSVAGEERRFPALPETSGAAERAAGEVGAFRAAFSVPEALGPDLAGGLRLAIGAATIDLPEARLARGPDEAAPGATVIDRAVLAERRARRAELAEEATAQRAHGAEQALRGLESELAKLELRLERAVAERAALAAEAAEREREARAAAQHEQAERRRREESSEEATTRVEEAERAARELRARLGDAESRAESLAHEAEALRRRAAAPLDVLRAETALARRAIQRATALSRPEAGRAQLERALSGVAEAVRQLREAGVAIDRTAGQLRAERDAQRELAALLERERSARADAERAAEQERRGREAAESRLAAAEGARSDLREFVTTASEALRQAEGRIGEAQRAASSLSDRVEELEGQLLVERAGRERAEAALAAGRAAEPAADEEAAREQPSVAEEEETAQQEPEAAQEEAAREALPAQAPAPWLPAALERLLEREPASAVALLVDLVAGQSLNVERALDYRLSVPGEGVWSVSLRPGRGVIARMDPDSEPVGWGHFELTATPRTLLDVLVGGGSRRVRRRVKVGRTLRRRRALRSLPPAELRPGRLAAAGIWLDPLLLLRALAELVDPVWTAGHEFVVAHQVEGRRGRAFWVRVADRAPLALLDTAPPESPAVTIRSAQAAFQQFLGGEPPGAEKSAIRGDAGAVAAYTGWLERARSAHGAESGAPPRG